MPPAAESVPHGYKRQMAAKLLATPLLPTDLVVITDDDTEAIGPWGPDTFFVHGRAVMYYRPGRAHFWHRTTRCVFHAECPRNWQLRLPFAIRGKTLVAVAASPQGERALARWQADEWA